MNQITLVNESATRKFVEQAGQRVLTTAQLAESYETEGNLITKNFSRNKERYQQGKHFFLLTGEELKEFKTAKGQIDVSSNLNKLYLWTEKGAWLHAKSLNTDKAWDAYELLVDEYYRLAEEVKHSYMITDPIERAKKWIEEQQEKQSLLEENTMKDQIIAEYEPKVDYLDIILSTDDTVTTTQIAADYGMSARKLNETLHELGVQRKVGKQWLLYKTHMNQGYTKSHTSEIPKIDGGVKVVMNTKWTQKGRLFIYNTLKNEGYVPQGFEETNDKREV